MVELNKSVKSELPFVNEDVDLVLKEFLAIFFHFFRHGGAEHHDLLLVGSFNEDILNICSHPGAAEDLIALVDDEVFALG